MPFSEIKIDRRMLEVATHDRDAELVVRRGETGARVAVAGCARGRGNAQTLEFIRSAGFHSAQGRLFSEPVAPAQIEEILAEMAQSQRIGTGVWRTLRGRGKRVRRADSNANVAAS